MQVGSHTPARITRSSPICRKRIHVVASAASPSSSSHAVLHDFCMSIPYGALLAVGGMASLLFGAGQMGWFVASSGAFVAFNSFLSLRHWKTGRDSSMFTALTGGVSGGLTYIMYQKVQKGMAVVPSGVILVLSAAMCLFSVYNILAGGNPPKKIKEVTE